MDDMDATRQSACDESPGAGIHIRAFRADDASATLRIFEDAIRITALSRYTESEVRAWLGGEHDVEEWSEARFTANTFVAEVDGQVAGFTDLSATGYVDRLFVHPDFGRRGIGAALLEHVGRLAREEGIRHMSTHASLIARPVFEAAGFTVEYEETVERDGESLRRFFMTADPSNHLANERFN